VTYFRAQFSRTESATGDLPLPRLGK
jgi:hypothetical protein